MKNSKNTSYLHTTPYILCTKYNETWWRGALMRNSSTAKDTSKNIHYRGTMHHFFTIVYRACKGYSKPTLADSPCTQQPPRDSSSSFAPSSTVALPATTSPRRKRWRRSFLLDWISIWVGEKQPNFFILDFSPSKILIFLWRPIPRYAIAWLRRTPPRATFFFFFFLSWTKVTRNPFSSSFLAPRPTPLLF